MHLIPVQSSPPFLPPSPIKSLEYISIINIYSSGAKTGDNAAFRSPRRRPRSADPAPAAAHIKLLANGHEPHPAPVKPTGKEALLVLPFAVNKFQKCQRGFLLEKSLKFRRRAT